MNMRILRIRQFLATLFIAAMISPFGSSGQTTDKASDGQITELKFPYRKGFHLSYSGKVIDYDRYNFPESTLPSTFTYYISDEVKEGDRWIVNFQFHSITDTNTISFDKTYLFIDDGGMYFWIENDPQNVRNGVQAKLKEKKTHAITLPLHAGDTWKTMGYDEKKAQFTCSTLDTVIETKKGSIHCFAIYSVNAVQSDKEYTVYSKTTDYYNQDIGKVATNTLVYVVFLANGKSRRINESDYVLEDYYKDEK